MNTALKKIVARQRLCVLYATRQLKEKAEKKQRTQKYIESLFQLRSTLNTRLRWNISFRLVGAAFCFVVSFFPLHDASKHSYSYTHILYTLRLDQFFFHFRLKMKYLMRVNHDFRIINFICVFFVCSAYSRFHFLVGSLIYICVWFHCARGSVLPTFSVAFVLLTISHLLISFVSPTFHRLFIAPSKRSIFASVECNWANLSWKIDLVNYPFENVSNESIWTFFFPPLQSFFKTKKGQCACCGHEITTFYLFLRNKIRIRTHLKGFDPV